MNETIDSEPEPPGRLRVGITYNLKKNIQSELPDAEAEFDEEDTIRAIQNALEKAGCKTGLYEASEDLPMRLLEDRPDIVFNIAEGMHGRGREAHVPAICSFLRIPFTGSDETTLCIAMDKALTKRLVSSSGINTPDCTVIKCNEPHAEIKIPFPVIVKPNTEGSSKGVSDVSVVSDAVSLRRVLSGKLDAYKQDMLVEQYISGREFTIGILGNGKNLRVFPPMEIIFNDENHRIYSYEVKRNFRQYVKYKCPPDIRPELSEKIMNTAETIFRLLDCRDMCRMDFRLSEEGQLHFIEINPLPGLAPGYSDFPMLAEFCGTDYTTLVQGILESAVRRYGLRGRGREKP